MPAKLSAISWKKLIKLLKKDGWIEVRRATHGLALKKEFPEGRTRVTIVLTSNDSLPIGTLKAILGPRQTDLGEDGLLELLEQ